MIRREHYYSERQRTIVLTFKTVEEAEAWDAAGQPLDDLSPSSTQAGD